MSFEGSTVLPSRVRYFRASKLHHQTGDYSTILSKCCSCICSKVYKVFSIQMSAPFPQHLDDQQQVDSRFVFEFSTV